MCLATSGAAAAFPVSGFTIWTIAGTGFQCQTAPACGDGGAATSAPLHFPEQLAVDGTGDVIFADSDGNEVREISPSGTITRVAGNGTACANPSSCGDGGAATSAELRGPDAVAVDAAGNVYIADSGDNEIRKVSPSGTITTVAGNGTQCASISTCGNGGAATSAEFKSPEGVALDRAGDIYIADTGDNEVRKVSASGTITAFAGTGTACGSPPSCGDGGLATSATLTDPMGLALDGAGDLFIADTNDNEVREVSTSGMITRIAGNGTACGTPTTGCGDGTTPTFAQLNFPAAVAVDGAGNVYIADT